MATHELGFVVLESSGLHEDTILNTNLPDVMQHARKLDPLDVSFREPHLARNRSCNPRNAIRMTTCESILRVNRLRQRTHGAKEEISRLGVFGECVTGENERNEERNCCPVTDTNRNL